jgi:hypothetical protein
MSIFAHAHAIDASKPNTTKCANCFHHEAIIADLQAWVEDLRQSRDRWRDLALAGAERSADKTASVIDEIRAELRKS